MCGESLISTGSQLAPSWFASANVMFALDLSSLWCPFFLCIFGFMLEFTCRIFRPFSNVGRHLDCRPASCGPKSWFEETG